MSAHRTKLDLRRHMSESDISTFIKYVKGRTLRIVKYQQQKTIIRQFF